MNRNPPRSAHVEQESLAQALARVGDELARHEPPPTVRAAVQARLSRRVLVAQTAAVGDVASPSYRWAPWTMAALCGALLLLSTTLLLREPSGASSASEESPWMAGRVFVPVVGAERWPLHGGARRQAPAWLVRAELPRERLAEFGLPFDPSRAAEIVNTELLMQADGEVLAVRVLAAETPQR